MFYIKNNVTKVAKNNTHSLSRTNTDELLEYLDGIEVCFTNEIDKDDTEESGEICTNGIAPEHEPTNPK